MATTELTSLLELRPANDLLDDYAELTRRYGEDGYLFFRGGIPVDLVLEVQADLRSELERQGAVEKGADEPIWTGLDASAIDSGPFYANPSYQRLCESSGMLSLLEQLFGEPVTTFKNTVIRYTVPSLDKYVTPAHQDAFTVASQNDDFRPYWIPLMEIEPELGGLAVAVGSHTRGMRPHLPDPSAVSVQLDRQFKSISVESVDEPWATTKFRPGDLLVFSSYTIHRALPNVSRKVRLSLDARAQPASTPRSWVADQTVPQMQAYRRTAREALPDVSADDFEVLIMEMMRQGIPPDDRPRIEELRSAS